MANSGPIIEPATPYLGSIANLFDCGQMIRIHGTTAPIGNRVDVNLLCGDSQDADIAFHISLRLAERYVARNSFVNGEWGAEEDEGALTFGIGERFEIIVMHAADDFKVAINGKHFCAFPHRVQPTRISHLKVEGDLSIALISFEQGDPMTANHAEKYHAGYDGFHLPLTPQKPPYIGHYQSTPPPPPGYQGGQDSGYGDLLGTAGEVIAGAIRSGMADKLIGSLTGGHQSHDQNHPQTHQQQPNFGGQGSSLGGLADTLLGSLTGGHHQSHDQNHPQTHQQQPNFGGQGSSLGGLADTLLGSLTGGHQNQSHHPEQQQPAFQLPNVGGQGSVGGLGSVGSILGGLAETLLHPKQGPQGGHAHH